MKVAAEGSGFGSSAQHWQAIVTPKQRRAALLTLHLISLDSQHNMARIGVPKDVAAVAAPEAGGVKLFGKWDAQEVEVKDISLQGECARATEVALAMPVMPLLFCANCSR